MTCRQLVYSELRTSAQRATKPKPSRRCNSTVEREQLIGQARHEDCDIQTLSMTLTWPACRWTCATVFATEIRYNTSYVCVIVAKV